VMLLHFLITIIILKLQDNHVKKRRKNGTNN
jgi:hypothetical protein